MAKVLIIDDSAMSRRVMRGILEGAGHEVIEAADGIAGIERYFLERPDLVTLDLIMEGMNGIEVIKKIRQMDKDALIVLSTADIQGATRDEALKEGAVDVINKPLTPEKVLDTLSRILKRG